MFTVVKVIKPMFIVNEISALWFLYLSLATIKLSYLTVLLSLTNASNYVKLKTTNQVKVEMIRFVKRRPSMN